MNTRNTKTTIIKSKRQNYVTTGQLLYTVERFVSLTSYRDSSGTVIRG